MHFTLLIPITLPEDMEQLLSTCPEQYLCSYVKEKRLLRNAEDTSVVSPQEISKQDRFDYLIEVLAAEQMAPFQHDTEDPRYIKFIDVHDEIREKYETGRTDCVRLGDGRIVPVYHRDFRRKYVVICGKVYKKHFGRLKQPKRTKKARQIKLLPDYPFKKMCPTFDSYAREHCGYESDKETGRYGFYANPRCQWDYYHIGGCWPFRFLVKDGCDITMTADYVLPSDNGSPKYAPDGYHWVTGARKCDIAWDTMRELNREHATTRFHQYETAFQSGGLPERVDSVPVTGEGIYRMGEWLYKAGESLEEHLGRLGISSEPRSCVDTFAYLDGEAWVSCGVLYSAYDEYIDERCRWDRHVAEFIEKLPEDTFLISVDYHMCL